METAMNHLPYRMGYLTQEMVEKAERELGETKEVKEKALEDLRNRIASIENLRMNTEEICLLQFLRAKKFDVKRSFDSIISMCHVRYSHPDFDPGYEVFLKTLSHKALSILPYRDKDGCIIFYIKYSNWNFKKSSFALMMHTVASLVFVSAYDPATQVCGSRAVIDLKGFSLLHLRYIPMALIVQIFMMEKIMNLRVKGIHCINGHHVVNFVWKILKYCTTDKLGKRINFHKCTDELFDHFDRSILPKECGGDFEGIGMSTELADDEFKKMYQSVYSNGFQ